MPMVTLKTMAGKPREAIVKTMKDINRIVAENLGYDPAHVWVFVDEVDDQNFVTGGRTWAELKPLLYPDR